MPRELPDDLRLRISKWGHFWSEDIFEVVFLSFYWLNDSWTRGFKVATCGFELVTRGFEFVTRGFELATRGFELVTRGSELVTRKVEVVIREFELVDLNW